MDYGPTNPHHFSLSLVNHAILDLDKSIFAGAGPSKNGFSAWENGQHDPLGGGGEEGLGKG